MKSLKTLILHKTKWNGDTFFNFVVTGTKKGVFAYGMYDLIGTIQFKKGKKEIWIEREGNAGIDIAESITDFSKNLKECYAESKNVLPYK